MANLASNQSWLQSDFANYLQQAFKQQFGHNEDVLNFLQNKMWQGVQHPQGYSPAALTAMRTGAIDNASREFAHAQQGLNEQEMSHGGADLPSGVNAQINAGLGAEEAAQKANAENQITLANENLKNENYWKSAAGLGGVAEGYNPLGYAGAESGATGEVGSLVNAATNVNNSGFGHMLEGSIAQGLGSEITGGNSTGSGTAAGFFGL